MNILSSFGGLGGAANDFAGAASDIFNGELTNEADKIKASGLRAEATDYGLAATLAGLNEDYTKNSTEIQQAALQRSFEKTQGATQATIAANGVDPNSGSAIDIMRANEQQGALAHAVLAQQGSITEAGYEEQKQTYNNMAYQATSEASAEEALGSKAEKFGNISGGIKGAMGIVSAIGAFL